MVMVLHMNHRAIHSLKGPQSRAHQNINPMRAAQCPFAHGSYSANNCQWISESSPSILTDKLIKCLAIIFPLFNI